MDQESAPKLAKKGWATPAVRTVDLSDDERAQLRASKDPMALLLKLRPDLKPGG